MLYLCWCYVRYHRWKTMILVLSITLVVFLPAALNLLIARSTQALTVRAESTPLLLGAKGSPLELALSSLYFDAATPTLTRYASVAMVRDSALAEPIPLYVRFRASGYSIVGTTLDYFDFRQLKFMAGRPLAMLGEAVIGSSVAHELGLAVGDSIVSSPESAFDLAGVYPLKMTVVGILERSFNSDDKAVFVDVKTAWIIEGLGHGHQDLDSADATAVMRRDKDRIVANASLPQYNEITAKNAESFHFHGDLSDYPISAVLLVPSDQKSGVILQGRLQRADGANQILRPKAVIEQLLDTVLTVQQFVIAAVALVGTATAALAVLVFLLSLRLRRRERLTLYKIGGSQSVIAGVMAAEVIAVLIASSLLAMMLTLFVARYGTDLIRGLLLS
jgi:putative ABC transport system permease protein